VRLLALQQTFRCWLTTESPEVAARFGDGAQAGLRAYLNNYRAQLLACLSASFPVLRGWIGDAAFEGAAATHIDNVPPEAWTLDDYGLDFPETLQKLYPANPEIPELARLERALAAAFVAVDCEPPVDPAHLANIGWDTATIHFVPSVRRVPVTTNVAAIWSAVANGDPPPDVARLPEPASLVIWRHDLAPRFRVVTAEEWSVLCQLRQGETFGSVCTSLIERLGEEQGPARAGSLLGQWFSDGLIAQVCQVARRGCVHVQIPLDGPIPVRAAPLP
jgi:hypothetical protein